MFRYIFHIYKKINLYLYWILAGNVGVQLLFLSVSFLIIFFILQFAFGVNDSLLFHQMTAYEYNEEENPLSLKIIYLVGVTFFSGFLVTILTTGVRNQLDRIIAGDARFSFKDHILFFGYNEEAEEIIRDILTSTLRKKRVNLLGIKLFDIHYKYPDIVVVVDTDVIATREIIESSFGKLPRLHVLHGSAKEHDLLSYYPEYAKSIYIVTGKHTDTDFRNLELYKKIYQSVNHSNSQHSSWDCNVYLFLHEPSSLVFFRNRRYGENRKETDNEFLDYWNLKIINIDEIWAREIFFNTKNNITKRQTRITADSEECVHIVIFGMSNTGETIALSAAKYCHLPNFISKGVKTKITVIDDDFSQHRGVLHGRYSDFLSRCHYSYKRIADGKFEVLDTHHPPLKDDLTDIEWEFVESIADDSMVQDMLALLCMDRKEYVTVFVCGHNEVENINIALGLPKIYFDTNIPIWLYAKKDYSIGEYLSGSRYDNIYTWGRAGGIKLDGSMIEKAAINLVKFEDEMFGANGVISWQNDFIDTKQDKFDVVTAIPITVESMKNYSENDNDFILEQDEIDLYAQVEHVRWIVSKLIAGYRPTSRDFEKDIADFSNNTLYRHTLKKHFFNEYITHFRNIEDDISNYDKQYIEYYKQYWISNRT